MPVFIGPLLGFSIGIAFAWASARELNVDRAMVFRSRGWWVVWMFAGMVFAPICLYFAVLHGDWAWTYLVDSSSVPSAVVLGGTLLDVVSIPLGFMVAAPWAHHGQLRRLLTVGVPPVAVSLLFVVAFSSRLATFATYNQFHGNFGTQSLVGTPLGYGIVWMWGVLGAGVMLTTRLLRRLAMEVVSQRADHG